LRTAGRLRTAGCLLKQLVACIQPVGSLAYTAGRLRTAGRLLTAGRLRTAGLLALAYSRSRHWCPGYSTTVVAVPVPGSLAYSRSLAYCQSLAYSRVACACIQPVAPLVSGLQYYGCRCPGTGTVSTGLQ
jgi:hypothetical protein